MHKLFDLERSKQDTSHVLTTMKSAWALWVDKHARRWNMIQGLEEQSFVGRPLLQKGA